MVDGRRGNNDNLEGESWENPVQTEF